MLQTRIDIPEEKVALLKSKLKELPFQPEVFFVNSKNFMLRVINIIYSEMKTLSMTILIAISILLIFSYGFKKQLFMMIPLLMSQIWTFGVMGWLGIPINMINSLVSLFVFGLVIDYIIFFSTVFQTSSIDAHKLSRTSGAIFISALTTMIGIGSLAFTTHPVLQNLGQSLLIGVSCGIFIVITLIPIQFSFIKHKNG